MKFKISCSELRNELLILSGVLVAKTTHPILGCILFEAKGGKLFLTATDLEVSLQSSIECEIEEEGAVAVPGKILIETMRELPDYPVEISSDEEFRVKLKTSSGEFKIFGADYKEYPQVPKIKKKVVFNLDSSKIKRMIEKVIFAVSRDELKGVLTGVLFQVKKEELRLVATDGHRLSKVVDKTFRSDEITKDIIIPPKALNLFMRNVDSEKITFTVGESFVVFDLGNKCIYSSLLQGEFPDYESVIPLENEKKLIVDREKFIQSLRIVQVFANRMTLQVKMNISKGEMEIVSEDVDRGEGREKVPVDYDDESMTIGFNAGYLLDSLKCIETEDVLLELKEPDSGCIILPRMQKEGEEHFMLVMPIKLKD